MIWKWLQSKTFWSSLEITTSPLPQRLTLPGSGLSWLNHIIPIFDLCGVKMCLHCCWSLEAFSWKTLLFIRRGRTLHCLSSRFSKSAQKMAVFDPFFPAQKPLSLRWKQTQTYTPPFAFPSRVRKCKSYAFGAFLLITLQSSVSRVLVAIFQTFCAKVLNCLPNSHKFGIFLHFSQAQITAMAQRLWLDGVSIKYIFFHI